MEENYVSLQDDSFGYGRKFCFSAKRKRMKSLPWQNCLQNCCKSKNFDFYFSSEDRNKTFDFEEEQKEEKTNIKRA